MQILKVKKVKSKKNFMSNENILYKILEYKKKFVAKQKQIFPEQYYIDKLKNISSQNDFSFYNKLLAMQAKKQTAIIAEIKKASPSKGIIKQNFEPQIFAKNYIQGGAACISVLTDEQFFMGSVADFASVKNVTKNTNTPLLQKDFIVDEYQIYHAKFIGADCILLIMSCLDIKSAIKFEEIAICLGMSVLCECHNKDEVMLATKHLKTNLIGINNRNLNDFSTNIQNTADLFLLAKKNEQTVVVCESGIEARQQIEQLQSIECYCFLIGTSIMMAENQSQKLQQLCNTFPQSTI